MQFGTLRRVAFAVAFAMLVPIHTQAAGAGSARQVFTAHHRFRIDVLTVPAAIPLAKLFNVELAVFDAGRPTQPLSDAKLDVTVGMTHGKGHEFMHGMESSLVLEKQADRFQLQGLMLHMEGEWTVRVRVRQGGRSDTADLTLQCCAG